MIELDPTQIRQVAGKESGKLPQKSVLSFLAGDNTGAVMVTLWDNAMQQFLDMHSQIGGEPLRFCLENFSVTPIKAVRLE